MNTYKKLLLALMLMVGTINLNAHPTLSVTATQFGSQPDTCKGVTDYQVFNTTAKLWIKNWSYLLGELIGESVVTSLGTEATQRTLNALELGALLLEGSFDGTAYDRIRIYFAKKDTSKENSKMIPDLIFLNAAGCHDDTKRNPILVTNSECVSICRDSATKYIHNWHLTRKNIAVLDTINAYTYSREAFMNAKGQNDEDAVELTFYFAIHMANQLKLKSGSTEEYAATQGYLVTDLVMNPHDFNTASSTVYVNFAQPCPELCDTGSIYYKASTGHLPASVGCKE